jgi:hypothetical protein
MFIFKIFDLELTSNKFRVWNCLFVQPMTIAHRPKPAPMNLSSLKLNKSNFKGDWKWLCIIFCLKNHHSHMVVFVEITSSFYHIVVNIWYVRDCYAHTMTWNMFLFSSSHLNFFEIQIIQPYTKHYQLSKSWTFSSTSLLIGLSFNITYHHYWDNY